MKRFLLIALILSTPLLAACPKAPPTPVAAVADVGSKIEDTAHEIFTTAVAFNANGVQNPVTHTPLVPTAVVDQIALAVNKVGHVGLDLHAALLEYNADKAAGKDLTAAKLLVQQALNVVTNAMADIGKVLPAGTIQQVDTLITSVLSLVAQLKVSTGL
jgi:hypothetical protein